ncbi:cell division control protein 6 homolog B isoform X2 [Physcomitrium patens]|uniref:Cell division control protein n=1 Tax=Physcomitrium patens TaxID=3218 RepID=A0A2K1L1G3_PHYPA|nr:cell division control protein 6 homolog B-like isoform X2 [Physcomitrium patens]PNR59867.1 hypothetical protein PHYPA_002659 [Physcomitrium patens]|eukprot:XP_024401767.1 cell division control protein 6 homolog B-like isoform X2 [Physcomitrella patens]
MASTGVVLASADLVGPTDGVFEELTGPLKGWKRKLSGKKGGTPRKKDMAFVSPDGEEISNKWQLDKYLKSHPGVAVASDFEWVVSAAATPSGTPRRSARLTPKGRSFTEDTDEEMQPKERPLKRARRCLNGIGKKDGELPEMVNASTQDDEEIANGKKLSKIKENGNDMEKATLLRSGSDSYNLQLNSINSSSWDPAESSHILAVKKALHLSAIPSSVLCRDVEQAKVIEFCKSSIVQQVPGSIYVCGCPGTGKSLTMEQVKLLSVSWAAEANLSPPDIVSVNCTTLTDPRNIYQKVLQSLKQKEASDDVVKSWSLCLKELRQRVCDTSRKSGGSPRHMLLLIVDEMDYLITRNQEVLYDLFQLPTYPNSCCILIGIANAIDLTDRFLPKLRSLNCRPDVITYPAYTKDQISTVLTQRLKGVPFTVFQTASVELCARKVAAASGDMRKALHVCRSALDILETEVRAELDKGGIDTPSLNVSESSGSVQRSSSIKPPHLVRIDHMAKALARTFRSPVVETIQNLPQHQQMVLCSAVRLFRRAKKDATLGELNKAYLDFCKSSSIPALAGSEFSSICRVLSDQALLKLGESREDRLRRVTLQVNQDDVVFALQGVRFFRNSLS